MAAETEAEDGTLLIRVTDIVSTDNGKTVFFDADNQTGSYISFGWVNSCSLTIETTEGDFSVLLNSLSDEIPIGKSSHSFTVGNNCRGEVKRIVISDLRLLEDGLPSERLNDVEIYNAEEGVSETVCKFDANVPDLRPTRSKLFVFVPAVVAILIIAVILIIVLRKNRSAKKVFAPYSDNCSERDDGDGFAPPPAS
ncbi:MAG: hypothetical protein Q4C01_04535 [Clostridia bacterium]|nr:hypothetical protein [Clostridia bacterium]